MNITLIGATGFTGAEFARLISVHPNFTLKHVVSRSGKELYSDFYPNLLPNIDLELEPLDIEKLNQDTDVYVCALPHGKSMEIVSALYSQTDKKIIDLSADFRYKDFIVYEEWYGVTHTAKELPAVYGLPELYRNDIKNARLVANPGCYTTCSILAMAPLVQYQMIEGSSIIINAMSGVTGAGKKLSAGTQFALTNENARAYSIGTHRHTSEIEEQLSSLYGSAIALNFTPHLIPVNRGILATCYADLRKKTSKKEIVSLFEEFYQDSKTVTILKDRLPELSFVVGSNNCFLGITVDERTNRVIVVSAIDNLIKGASGQAIENLNLMFNLPEETGLNAPAWYL